MRNLLYVIILLVVTGCGYSNSYPQALDEAQRLMQSDPSAALSRLNGLDVSEFHDSATMARWALLYSEAMVVNKLAAPTDTIVNIAMDYYGRNNLTAEFQKASRLKALMGAPGKRDDLATALYLQKEKEFMLYRERTRREQIMFVGIIILLIAAGVIAWMRQRIRMQSMQNESLMAEASGLRSRIAATRGDVNRLETTLQGLLDKRFDLIDSLCQTYYESQGTKTERKSIVDKVKSEIESVRTDSFPEMEKAVNACRNNILEEIKKSWPDMKADDYRLLVYLASGLSTRAICLLLEESADVVYKRKSRLKSRLKERCGSLGSDISAVF